jgi:hypothetical protein
VARFLKNVAAARIDVRNAHILPLAGPLFPQKKKPFVVVSIFFSLAHIFATVG